MDNLVQRQQLIEHAIALNKHGLSVGTSGNISLRCHQGLLITPSGLTYQQLQLEDIVLLDTNGTAAADQPRQPSSEWHFHCDIYQARPDINAIVHAHPTFSTALACSKHSIPAFHYMVAVAGGEDIPLAPYALFGSEELSYNACLALTNRQACLLENHGMIAIANNLADAFQLALEVENLAQHYCEALKIGPPTILNKEQMAEVLEKFKHYGQSPK